MSMSNITNSTNLYQVFLETNNVSNGSFMLIFIFFLFTILIILFNKLGNPAQYSALYASALMLVINILLFVLGFFGWLYVIISFLLTCGLLISVKMGGG